MGKPLSGNITSNLEKRNMDKQIIVYEPNEQMKMEVKTDGETVWLTQQQMADPLAYSLSRRVRSPEAARSCAWS